MDEFPGNQPDVNFLAGGGEMSRLIRSKDWSSTPLGPIGNWPQSLRTTVSLCLASNFPINIIWGPEHTQIYNDGYRAVCGEAHPALLGTDYSVAWASAWAAIGEPFEHALAGNTSFLENQRMFLNRNGYLEETFFTFSTSPIRDETGGIGGLFHPVTETTTSMLGERRMRALRDLTADLSDAKNMQEVFDRAIVALGRFALDLPFVLFYHLDPGTESLADSGPIYRLVGQTGFDSRTMAAPASLRPDSMTPWPVADCIASQSAVLVDGVAGRIGAVQCGPYDELPDTAFALRLALPGSELPVALMIAGVSARLPVDDAYRGFYDLVAAALGAALGNASAYQHERSRAEALAALDRSKTTFFSNVSHEFRTPLTLMLGPIEEVLADSNGIPDLHREQLETVHRNALRLLKLVNSLLDFSRILASRAEARYEPTDLAALTAELASNFRSACERAGLALVVDCLPLGSPVHVDTDMWEKIVLNLLSNAFKFTFDGAITIALRAAGTEVELLVSDTGIGIPPSELPRVFERFHRVEGQRGRTHEGSGIGLALVDELVRLQGGTITVSSVPDKGTTFRVVLPLGTGHLPEDRLPGMRDLASTAVHASAYVEEALRWLPDGDFGMTRDGARSSRTAIGSTPVDGRPRIVLADDNADMRAYVARILEQGGYDVEAVGDGAAALAAVRRGVVPDLVLTDVMMPGIDGFEVLRVLRADPAMEGLLVILLSARTGEEARIDGLAAGADDYLVKPFNARELRARIDGAIGLSRQRREAAAREQDLRAEIATQRGLAALRDSEQRLAFALDAGHLGSWEIALADQTFTASATCLENLDVDMNTPLAKYDDLIGHIYPEDRRALEDAIAQSVSRDTILDAEFRVMGQKGRLPWVQVRGHAVYAADGVPTHLVGVSLDVTARKQAEAQQRLLLNELNHRVKNTLATVQSIVMQTQRNARSADAFTDDLNARLVALARAHDLLTEAAWDGASLGAVVDRTLAPYAANADDVSPRVTAAGPPVLLRPNAAVTLNMAFHELASNAAKYGALSVRVGRVMVTWRVDHPTESLEIVWSETGGPPVERPSRRGFGSRLIERGLSSEFGGEVSLDYLPTGVCCRMRLPLSAKIVIPH